MNLYNVIIGGFIMYNYGMGYNYNQYNPMMTAQQRINNHETQYPQYTQQPQQSKMQFNVIPVSNIDEANAYIVDISGTPMFFYNAKENQVYMKRTNMETGEAIFATFSKMEAVKKDVKGISQTTYENDIKTLNEKIDGLYQILNGSVTNSNQLKTKKAVKDAE